MNLEGEQITLLLKELSSGRKDAGDRLIPLIYVELRKMAARYMSGERPGHTLQPTALVHEAYLKLVNQASADWKNRAHFFAVAAQVMRHILVDHARELRALKRGGADNRPVTLDEGLAYIDEESAPLLALDEALDRLAALDPRQSRIVELRYFVGLSVEETAEVVQLSPRSVKREWRLAKAWLYAELSKPSTATGHL